MSANTPITVTAVQHLGWFGDDQNIANQALLELTITDMPLQTTDNILLHLPSNLLTKFTQVEGLELVEFDVVKVTYNGNPVRTWLADFEDDSYILGDQRTDGSYELQVTLSDESIKWGEKLILDEQPDGTRLPRANHIYQDSEKHGLFRAFVVTDDPLPTDESALYGLLDKLTLVEQDNCISEARLLDFLDDMKREDNDSIITLELHPFKSNGEPGPAETMELEKLWTACHRQSLTEE